MNKNFNEIYQSIYTNGIHEITKLKERRNVGILIFFNMLILTAIFLLIGMSLEFMMVCVFITFAALVNFIISNVNYRKGFKKLVIEKIVHAYNPDFQFYAENGVSNFEYRNSLFDRFYDNFYSEDLIQGFIEDQYSFKMSQVKTEKEEIVTNSNGNREVKRETIFQGLFGIVDIDDNILMRMDITSNNFLNKYNKSRIEVDSGEFEKKYDMFATDKVRAMEIFTADIIEEFNKFHEDTGYVIQIKVELNKLYFRISCGDVFEVPAIKDALSYDYMYKNFRMIDFPIGIISKILKNAITTRN